MTAVLLLSVAILSFWLPVAAHPCAVTIHPKELAVEFGGSVILNCTFSCANHVKMDWEASLQGSKQEGKGWISLNITSVTEWSFQPLCLVRNGESEVLKRMMIYVYRFSTPDIYVASEIVDGHSERIVCNISSLRVRDMVPHNINISLSRGGNILNSSYGNPSVEYNFVASLQQDDGAEILCVANVQVGSEVLEKSANTTLGIVGQPYNVSVSKDHIWYKAGANVTVTCNAEGKPFPQFLWDIPSKAQVEFSDSNKTITIHAAQSSHNGTYQCVAHNVYGKNSAQVDIFFEGNSHNWIVAMAVLASLLIVFAVIGCIFYFHRQK